MNVVLYTTHCPKCNVIQKKLDKAGIKYEIVTNMEEMKSLGLMSSPYLKVDDDLLLDFISANDWIMKYGDDRI